MVEGVDSEALLAWMDHEGLGSGPLGPPTVLDGGTQNILVSFERAERRYVLRRPPIHLRDNSNETMRREARVLAALADTEVPHPGLIAACGTTEVLGAAFYLMEPVDGFNPRAAPLPSPHADKLEWQWRMGLDMVRGIATLANVNYRRVGLEDFGRPDGFLERQVGRWADQLESYQRLDGWPGPQSIPGVTDVANWLEAHLPVDYRAGIIHGDYHLANVLFHHDRPELAAIVDWELATIGDPLVDLGWLMATWPIEGEVASTAMAADPWDGFPAIDDLVAYYGELTQRDMSAARWYGVLGCYKLGILLEGTFARACAGKAPTEIGDELHAHTLDLFARAADWTSS